MNVSARAEDKCVNTTVMMESKRTSAPSGGLALNQMVALSTSQQVAIQAVLGKAGSTIMSAEREARASIDSAASKAERRAQVAMEELGGSEEFTTSCLDVAAGIAADNEKLVQRIKSIRNLIPKDGSTELKRRSSKKHLTTSKEESNHKAEKPLRRRTSKKNLIGQEEDKDKKELKRRSSKKHLTRRNSKKCVFIKEEENTKQPLKRHTSQRNMSEDKRSSNSNNNSSKPQFKRSQSMRRCKTMDDGLTRKTKDKEEEHKRNRRRARRSQSQPEGALEAPVAAIAKETEQEQPQEQPQQPQLDNKRRSVRRDVRSSQIQQALKPEAQKALPEEEEEEQESEPTQEPLIVEDKEEEDEKDAPKQSIIAQLVPRFSFALGRAVGVAGYGQMEDESCATNNVQVGGEEKEDAATAPMDSSHSSSENSALQNDNSDSSQNKTTNDGDANLSPTKRTIRQRQRRGLSRKSGVAAPNKGASTTSRRQGSTKKRATHEEDALPPLIH